MTYQRRKRTKGFSLIELVIVVVIIGIIGAIAIPRMSRGSAGANDSALVGDLAVLRNAIDLYAAEHGGTFPAYATLTAQLTQFTDKFGAAQVNKDATHIYGPYVRKIPPLPVGTNKGDNTFTDTLGTAGIGWFYDQNTGEVRANLPVGEADDAGTPYNQY